MAIIYEYTINEILENTHHSVDSLEIHYVHPHLDYVVEIGVILDDESTIVVYGDSLQDATDELAAILL
jgi:hypothetical protein